MASRAPATQALDFTAHGVTVAVHAEDPALAERIAAALPPGAQPAVGAPAVRFAASFDADGLVQLERDGSEMGAALEPEVAVELLAERLATTVATRSPSLVFVRGAAVLHDGRAIVLPGGGISGRTTLHDALVDLGAESLGDGFVVIDDTGSVCGPDGNPVAPVGTIAVAPYRPGARWDPKPGTAADGGLALFSQALTEREPGALLEVLSRAARGATVLESDRGEAAETARALLAGSP